VTLPYYSNFGAPLNAIAAPGGSYPVGPDTGVSGWVRGACSSGIAHTLDGLPGNGAHSFGCFNLGHVAYVQAMGTSASAALAAGAAALVRSAHPGWTPDQVIAALRASGIPAATLPAAPLLNPAALIP
jgi:subtilisin family serine protease